MCASPGEGAPVRLSRRESEVAGLVAQGLTNREIATKLFLSERTVDGHLEHVREKLGVNTRAQIAAWVVRQDATEVAAVPSDAISRPAPSRRLMARPRLWVATALVLASLAAVVGVLRLISPTGPSIVTVAGTDFAGSTYPGGNYSGDGQLAINAVLSRPSDLAVGNDGSLYIADYGNARVRKVAKGVIATVAGGATAPVTERAIATSVSLGYASAIAVDSQDRLYVLANLAGMLEVWRLNDRALTRVISLGPSFGGELPGAPNLPVGGLAIASDGTLYVADRAGNRVWKVVDGVKTLYAGTGDSGFGGDNGAAIAALLAWPIGVAVDKRGDLYIADSQNNRIRKIDNVKKTIDTFAGSCDAGGDGGDDGPARMACLSFPFGVAVGPDGSVFIADRLNNRIRKVTTDGVIHAFAGDGQGGFFGDHRPALQAELSGPEAIALDNKGDLFIADTENQRVREVIVSP